MNRRGLFRLLALLPFAGVGVRALADARKTPNTQPKLVGDVEIPRTTRYTWSADPGAIVPDPDDPSVVAYVPPVVAVDTRGTISVVVQHVQ